MQQYINLFIDEEEIEFQKAPDILFNYTINDLTNPTIVKNSYSKTLKIDGTPKNNNIFGNIWQLDRQQLYGDTYSSVYFNPSKKANFILYINGDIYESGYVQLDKIEKVGNNITYSMTLYGGLGEFFYSLSYDDDGNDIKLYDLNYTTSGGSNELNFNINKETVNSAWTSLDTIDTQSDNLFDIINFAPCYEGKPQDFSADKCLINYKNKPTQLLSATTTEEGYFTLRNGHSLATLPDEMTMWETFDLRSYLQRPILRVKKLVEAVKRKAEEKGYSLNLDNTFFNSGNTYYNNTWITLPRISELEFATKTESTGTTITINQSVVDDRISEFVVSGLGSDLYTSLSFSGATLLCNSTNYDDLYFCEQVIYEHYYMTWMGINELIRETRDYDGGLMVQMVAYSGNTAVGASNAYWLTNMKVDGTVFMPNGRDIMGNATRPAMGKNLTTVLGHWHKVSGGNMIWVNDTNQAYQFNFTVDTAGVMFTRVSLVWTWVANYAKYMQEGDYTALYPSTAYVNYSGWTSNYAIKNLHPLGEAPTLQMIGNAIQDDNSSLSNKLITKKELLNTKNSPCSYFLDYCKQFGLYFYKNSYDNTINVLTRDNFYKKNTIVDIEDKIDRKKLIKVTPLTFEYATYNLMLEPVDGEFNINYSATTNSGYGCQKLNTGYNFNADSSDVFVGNMYKSAIECEEKSKYFQNKIFTKNPIYMHKGMKYDLYYSSVEQNTSATTTLDCSVYNIFGGQFNTVKNYNWFSAPQFHTEDNQASDGSGVLLFYRGKKECKDINDTWIPFYITDDTQTMYLLNDSEPCWYLNFDEYDLNGNRVAISATTLPSFGRYEYSGNTITKSLDFGNPRQLYMLNKVITDESTIYYQYWKKYLEDLYDVNNRVVEVYMLFNDKPTEEALRKFYWFDNSLWRINKIVDWNMCSHDTTKFEFVKVNDINNY